MNRIRILIFQLILNSSVFGQEYKAIEFDFASFALRDSIKKDLTFSQIIESINHYCSTDTQKLFLVAGWIYENIDFDLEKLNSGGEVIDYRTVFELKKGTCNDYAILFAEFCNQLEIKNEIIEGYVPEYNSDNRVYYETNHAWNVIKLGEDWYHCDLLGFSGFLKMDKLGNYHFIKQPNTNNFLTQDLYFISKHIPADPIWQLSNYPIPLDSLILNGYNSKVDSAFEWFDFENEIDEYTNLTGAEKKLRFADNANAYNKNNSNVIVINYYNAAIDLINNWNNDRSKLIEAKSYLEKAKRFVPYAKNGVEVLKTEIERGVEMINNHVP
jgi:hypothetical protein